ncbi:unnamed protein product [Dovyalis caffra]|uniref:Uncharacterized protein n=1 Tax=Dovyalis caffra TaxID=77055 RepID=A0AAV1RD92_9ROSI|nr:unnamed protein product [Dovyalis caffra]
MATSAFDYLIHYNGKRLKINSARETIFMGRWKVRDGLPKNDIYSLSFLLYVTKSVSLKGFPYHLTYYTSPKSKLSLSPDFIHSPFDV